MKYMVTSDSVTTGQVLTGNFSGMNLGTPLSAEELEDINGGVSDVNLSFEDEKLVLDTMRKMYFKIVDKKVPATFSEFYDGYENHKLAFNLSVSGLLLGIPGLQFITHNKEDLLKKVYRTLR